MPKFCAVSLHILAQALLLGLVDTQSAFLASKMQSASQRTGKGGKACYIDENPFLESADVYDTFRCNWY
ncbi:hypothetical protein NI483_002935 [Salmonella enterica]|nr:hypothetical protein [Salmonella enterica]EJJ4378308.1 hypothetical protein [Salmonella enterica]